MKTTEKIPYGYWLNPSTNKIEPDPFIWCELLDGPKLTRTEIEEDDHSGQYEIDQHSDAYPGL